MPHGGFAPKTARPRSDASLNHQYLLAYNAVSFVLWLTVLTRVTLVISTAGLNSVYSSVGLFARNVQTLAILEPLHSLVGLVRAPFSSTFAQTASRLWLVWGIVDNFHGGLRLDPSSILTDTVARNHQLAYTGMLTAWSVAECVRYSYFVLLLWNGNDTSGVPGALTWARYNAFRVLYPLGISCECWLIWHALPLADMLDKRYAWLLRAVLIMYVPGKLRQNI